MAACGQLLFLLVSFGLAHSVERGFVYCPAYPCTCESLDGALVINCRHLYLSTLPKFLSFDGRITELSLRHNSIQTLPAYGFRGLLVEQLDLLNNAVTFVHQDAFIGLEKSLRSLSLQLYAMYGLPTTALSRLTRLHSLIVVGCNQRELVTELLLNLTALEELHLTGCRIAHIQSGALSPMLHLKTLVLSQNALQSQHLAEIWKLGDLLVLDLSSNDIRNLSSLSSPAFSKLRSLKVGSNKLTQITKVTFDNLDFSLEELDLRDNHLDDLSLDSLACLRLLLRLDVSHNDIYKLSGNYFTGMRYLQTLNLANNKIQVISKHSFQGLGSSLLQLDLHGNPLQLIERGTFLEFRVLETLNLRNTKLGQTFRQYTFDGLSFSLKYLDVSMSQLISDDIEAWSDLTNITDLVVSNNHIYSIDLKVLALWGQLTRANFSYNNVSTFVSRDLAVSVSSLKTLDLSWNNIQIIEACAFFVFRSLYDVRLEGNPLACNCSLAWLFRWLQVQHANEHLATHNWTCSTPASLKDSHFSDLQFADLKCPHLTNHEDNCLKLYNSPSTHNTLTDNRIAQLHSTPSLNPLYLNISRPDASSVYVEWLVGDINDNSVNKISLTRHNDSVLVQTVTLLSSSENYTFVNIDNNVATDVCFFALSKRLVPLAERCHAVPDYIAEERSPPGPNGLGSLIQNSFLPLLFIYISGSLAVAFLIACVVVCIQRKRQTPRRVKPFYLTYPAWYDNRSISSSSLVYDPHFIHSGNLHTRSTLLADRLGLGSLDRDSSIPQDLPSMVSSRRESRLCPGNHNCTCSSFNSVPPRLGADGLAGPTEVNNEFFFHF